MYILKINLESCIISVQGSENKDFVENSFPDVLALFNKMTGTQADIRSQSNVKPKGSNHQDTTSGIRKRALSIPPAAQYELEVEQNRSKFYENMIMIRDDINKMDTETILNSIASTLTEQGKSLNSIQNRIGAEDNSKIALLAKENADLQGRITQAKADIQEKDEDLTKMKAEMADWHMEFVKCRSKQEVMSMRVSLAQSEADSKDTLITSLNNQSARLYKELEVKNEIINQLLAKESCQPSVVNTNKDQKVSFSTSEAHSISNVNIILLLIYQ